MNRYLLFVLYAFIVSSVGCSTVTRTEYAVGSTTWHQEQLKQITAMFNNGEISQEDFDQMKADADERHLKWKVGAGRGVRVR